MIHWTPIKPSLCACLGPLNGEQYCNCTMVQKQLPRSEGHIRQQEELKARILQELDAVEKGLNSNALELAADLESVGVYTEAAALLRRQHEAIKQLMEALDHAKDYAPIGGDAFERAKQALADTEDFK